MLAFRLAGLCLDGEICCRIDRFTVSGACADACRPFNWLVPAWTVESAAESIVLQFLVLALMLAGLPIGWPCLEGGICCRINHFACSGACADACSLCSEQHSRWGESKGEECDNSAMAAERAFHFWSKYTLGLKRCRLCAWICQPPNTSKPHFVILCSQTHTRATLRKSCVEDASLSATLLLHGTGESPGHQKVSSDCY